MNVTLGIDMGMSTCKIIGLSEDKLLLPVQKLSSVSSLEKVLDIGLKDFFIKNNLSADDITKIMITGVGSSYISGDILDIPTFCVAEFDANGAYGEYVYSDYRAAENTSHTCTANYIIISMGTGSSYVHVNNGVMAHLGGLALGGGTIQGLANVIFKNSDFEFIKELSSHGNIHNIDLCMGDITKTEIPGLPSGITASNFAKATGKESDADIAEGIVHTVIENVLQTGALMGKTIGVNTFVLMGGLASYPQCVSIGKLLQQLHPGIQYICPEHAVYGSAIGAALLK